MSEIVNRPWGTYQVLYDGADCKVKRIVVNPGQRLSLQSHQHRKEIWAIVAGTGYVEIHKPFYEDAWIIEAKTVFIGSTITIEKSEKHRIKNEHSTDLLVFVETQIGENFDENDITRYEDDYGRVEKINYANKK